MNWEMCFKEAHEKEKSSTSLIFAGFNFGVGTDRRPMPHSAWSWFWPGYFSMPQFLLCGVDSGTPSQARAE